MTSDRVGHTLIDVGRELFCVADGLLDATPWLVVISLLVAAATPEVDLAEVAMVASCRLSTS